MMMKSVGETMYISIVNPKCPTPTSLLEGEDIVWSFMKVNVRTMAKEMMTQTKNSILGQAAQAMLAQANQQPQGVLQLLR
ncbi:flagellin [Heyndrickxia sp. MSNUG]|uniref:flagellin n=1 Tax=Heyndrickxia sp. MSNUG TaxID=3136677 RepID=UPI003C2C7850